MRLETEPTGPDKLGSKPKGERVYLFLVFTINSPSGIIEFLDNFYPIAYNASLCEWEVAKPLQNIGSDVSLSARVALLQR